MTAIQENARISAIRNLMATYQDRRTMLKAAAAAGLIPVLTGAAVAQRAAAQDSQPVRGGTFVTLGQDAIESLSPEDTGETVQWVPIVNLFDGLYSMNEMYELEPVLADSYEPSADGLTYTFRLKTGVKFHNGDDFTAQDVLYTYNWIMDTANASTRTSNFELVDSVEAPDDQTVVVKLKEADATFMVLASTTLIYPKDDHAKKGEDAFKGAPVGTGPFTLGEWSPQQRVVLNAYEQYFRGRPNMDAFQVDVVPEAAGRMAALETGQADNSIWGLNAEDNETLKESGNFKLYETAQVATNHFPLNNKHPFLSDKSVRQAMMYALDRQSFADDIFLGQAQVATSNLSPAIEKYKNEDVTQYAYDPEKAKQLLEEAGWVEGSDGIREKDGVKAQFTMMVFQGDTQRRPEAEIAQQWWSDVGIQCDLEEGITSDILAGLVDGQYDAGLFNWTYGGDNGDPDARDTLGTGGANNFSQYSNEQVDQLLQEGVRELDEAKRIEIYKQIQEIVAEDLPFLYLLVLQDINFYANRVKGLPDEVLSAEDLYSKMYQFWLEEA
jgi:peptide/nickel transport system substrate-binding protein